jgi:hypothetical protein
MGSGDTTRKPRAEGGKVIGMVIGIDVAKAELVVALHPGADGYCASPNSYRTASDVYRAHPDRFVSGVANIRRSQPGPFAVDDTVRDSRCRFWPPAA